MIVNDDDDPKIKNNNTGDLCEVERNSSIDSMDRTVVRGPFQKIYLKDCFCCLIVHSNMVRECFRFSLLNKTKHETIKSSVVVRVLDIKEKMIFV